MDSISIKGFFSKNKTKKPTTTKLFMREKYLIKWYVWITKMYVAFWVHTYIPIGMHTCWHMHTVVGYFILLSLEITAQYVAQI